MFLIPHVAVLAQRGEGMSPLKTPRRPKAPADPKNRRLDKHRSGIMALLSSLALSGGIGILQGTKRASFRKKSVSKPCFFLNHRAKVYFFPKRIGFWLDGDLFRVSWQLWIKRDILAKQAAVVA
jgi:hypothetical protein